MAAKKGKEIRERHASDRIFNAAVIILSITTFIVIAYPLWFIVIALFVFMVISRFWKIPVSGLAI